MQMWIDERGSDRKLVIVGEEALYVDDSDKIDFTRALEALQEGASPAEVISDKADTILLSAITRVESDASDIDITVHYRDGKDKESEFWFFSTAALRDEIVAALHERLGDRFSVHTDRHSVIRAVYGSLLTLTLTILCAWILHGAAIAIREAEELDIDGRRSGIRKLFAWLLDLLGPTGVMLLAYVIAGFALWNFWRRASNPPVMNILQAEPYRPPTAVGVGIRYLILAGLAFITARAVIS